MVNARGISSTLLSAVTTTGASPEVDFTDFTMATFYITSSGVTTGGTMTIQAKSPSGTWINIDSRTIVANGDIVVAVSGAFYALRANLTARTDGTYTVQVVTK